MPGAKKSKTAKQVVRVETDMKELVPRFLANRRGDVASIRDAVRCGDFDSIRKLSEGMVGSGMAYGFTEITRLGQAIENAAVIKNLKEIGAATDLLSCYLEKVEVVYI